MKRNPGSHQNIGNLRNRARRAVREPVAGHGVSILDLVKGLIIDGRFGFHVQYDHWHTGALDKRQHGIRKGIGGDVQKQYVDVLASALMAGFARALWRIDQAKVDQLDARPHESRSYLLHTAFQPGLEPHKLAPVGIETYTAESYP